jgi:hypothetical protein
VVDLGQFGLAKTLPGHVKSLLEALDRLRDGAFFLDCHVKTFGEKQSKFKPVTEILLFFNRGSDLLADFLQFFSGREIVECLEFELGYQLDADIDVAGKVFFCQNE